MDVVLVRPRNPANVAAACRAMKNMGLGSIRLVGDDPGLGRPEARNLAYGAWDVLDSVRFFPGSALVFGPESSGLTTGELSLCHARVRIPVDPAQPSLNLAQAVLILAYEIRLSHEGEPPPRATARAEAGELEAALRDLEEGLVGIGYLNRDHPGAILAELRLLLARAGPTPREASLLRGLARQIRWAAGRIAGGAGESR